MGPYCAQCGQAVEDVRKPLRLLINDLAGDIFGFETRFFRTIGPLVYRPGFLTHEYLSGRREPYTPPLRTYVFASAVFFGLAALVGESVVKVQIDSISPEAEERVTAMVNAAVTYLHFFLVPLLAVFLMALFQRPRRFFVEHLVFALYYGASAFLLVTLVGSLARLLGADNPGPAVRVVGLAMVALLFFYLLIALRRVYQRPWPATILRGFAVSLLYLASFALATFALVLLAYWLV